MDGLILIAFLAGAFLGGLVSGLFGFAMGIVVSSIWLHFISPVDNTVLIIGCTAVTQGYGIWKLRHALDWPRAAPFILGGAVGVPLGAALLATPGWGIAYWLGLAAACVICIALSVGGYVAWSYWRYRESGLRSYQHRRGDTP